MSVHRLTFPIRFELAEPNPVLVKELRSRFRGPRAFWVLTGFLVVLTAVAWYVYAELVRQYSYYGHYGGAPSSMPGAEIGRSILMAVSVIEALLMAAIGPALMADSVSGEVERQTWDLLKATPLSGASIVLGKVAAAFGYVALLTLGALPVMSLGFIFGGTSLTGVLRIQGSMLTAGLMYLAIGVAWSCVVRRTVRAAILGYITVGGLMLLPILIPMLWWVLSDNQGGNPTDSRTWQHLVLAFVTPYEPVLLEAASGQTAGGSLWVAWALAMLVRLIIAGFLLLVASARVRPLPVRWAGPIVALALAALGLWVWGVATIDPWGGGGMP